MMSYIFFSKMPQYLDFPKAVPYPLKWLQFFPSLWAEGREKLPEDVVQVLQGPDEIWPKERIDISCFSNFQFPPTSGLYFLILPPDRFKKKKKVGLFWT